MRDMDFDGTLDVTGVQSASAFCEMHLGSCDVEYAAASRHRRGDGGWLAAGHRRCGSKALFHSSSTKENNSCST